MFPEMVHFLTIIGRARRKKQKKVFIASHLMRSGLIAFVERREEMRKKKKRKKIGKTKVNERNVMS